MIEKYGITFADGMTDADIELKIAFDVNEGQTSLHKATGFLGAYEHLHNAIDLIWNRKGSLFIWNEWTEMMLRAFIEEREISLCGAGSSWKSTSMSIYALCFWLANPINSRVVITSTTLDGLRARIWKEIMKFWRTSQCGFGNPVNHPHPKIQTTRGDDARGIFGIAVEAGDVDKAVENIQGRHAPNTLIEIDEMTGVSAAIVKAGANLEKGTVRFQMLGAANPESFFDQHGIFSEPKDGYESITKDTGKWRTKRGGLAVHLNGLKSPNIRAGKNINPGMITIEDVDISAKRDGENSPEFWKYVIGFWCPEGITKTVLTETIIKKFKATNKPKEHFFFVRSMIDIAALDPSFEGGDRKVLGFAKVGQIDEVDNENHTIHTVLCFGDTLTLKVDVTSKEPIHYQLVRLTREECKARGVEPYYFGMDSTGEGGGTADIFKREWSEDFISVEFGGRASSRQISDVNPRPGYEEYYDRVTELWYQFRRSVERNQIRGMSPEMSREFCQRNYDMAGNRIWVESKKKMKARTGRSPDFADMGAIMLEVALQRGLLSASSVISGRTRSGSWQSWAKDMVPLSRFGT